MNSAYADGHCEIGSWGHVVGNVGGWTCDNHEGYKVLEIFLYLGASQWESFWLPGTGAPNFMDYGVGSLPLADLDWLANTSEFPCEAPDIPSNETDAQLFGTSSTGDQIFWGAATKPLYRRPDILNQCRMVTTYYELDVHRIAQHHVLTGLTLGNARSAGTGAAIQRRARVVDPNQVLPVSYVLHSNETTVVQPATAVGAHPGFAQPVDISISGSNSFVDSLARNGVPSESDDLLLSLRHEFYDRMRFTGAGAPIRADQFDSYWAAAELLENAPAMQALFADDILVRDSNVAVCPEHPSMAGSANPSIKTKIGAAADLLGEGPARYVCAVDRGIAGTYDTHNVGGTTPTTFNVNANIYNVLHHLAENIHHPTDNPSGKIDLSDTMVVISTDFNRTPMTPNTRLDGRDHWPEGGVSVMIGGPISGPSIEGGIDATGTTEVSSSYSPTDIRGAILLAAGVDPFADANYRVSDFSAALTNGGFSTEVGIRDRLKSIILGV